MNKSRWTFGVGAVMVVVGVVMFLIFRNVDTPVVGLRQVGVVSAVLGLIEIAVAGWSMAKAGRSHGR